MKKLLLMQIGYFDNCIQEKRRKEMLNRQMQIVVLIVVVMVMVCILPPSAIAAVDNYSGDQAGFQSAIAGLSQQTFNFDELSEGDAITDQYLPWVSFSTRPGANITAETDAYGSYPTSGVRCAKVPLGVEPVASFFEMHFNDQPAQGVGFWLLDLQPGDAVAEVFDTDGGLLRSIGVPASSNDYVAILSDEANIERIKIRVTAGIPWDDGIGLDDVTTAIPEPAALSLWLSAELHC